MGEWGGAAWERLSGRQGLFLHVASALMRPDMLAMDAGRLAAACAFYERAKAGCRVGVLDPDPPPLAPASLPPLAPASPPPPPPPPVPPPADAAASQAAVPASVPVPVLTPPPLPKPPQSPSSPFSPLSVPPPPPSAPVCSSPSEAGVNPSRPCAVAADEIEVCLMGRPSSFHVSPSPSSSASPTLLTLAPLPPPPPDPPDPPRPLPPPHAPPWCGASLECVVTVDGGIGGGWASPPSCTCSPSSGLRPSPTSLPSTSPSSSSSSSLWLASTPTVSLAVAADGEVLGVLDGLVSGCASSVGLVSSNLGAHGRFGRLAPVVGGLGAAAAA